MTKYFCGTNFSNQFLRDCRGVQTSSGRGSLDALKREVRGTLKIKSVTARVCSMKCVVDEDKCVLLTCLSRRDIERRPYLKNQY